MTFNNYVESFAGLPIKEFEPGTPVAGDNVALRIGMDWDTYEEVSSPEKFYAQLFEGEGLESVRALVFGCWNFEGDGKVSVITDLLLENVSKLPNLKALFLGDVISEDCEVSWLEMDDVSKLWQAFPQLEILWIRGGEGLSLGKFQHENLRELVLQSGGLPKKVIDEVFQADLPNLEHLELWLGDEGYGGDSNVDDLKPLLTGSIFPKLKYLGLKNSEYSDDIAKAVAEAPILDRLETLDLSEGTLGDEGAEALCKSEKIGKLKKLDLHHHYMSDEMMNQISQLPCETDVSDQENEDEYGRYVSVSE